MGGREEAAIVPDQLPYSAAKKRASDLLEQARRQHAAAIASLRAERELYQRLGEQLTALADPGALDLEIAAIASRAGAAVAQAEEDGVRARRAQLAAERERDDAIGLRGHADAAAEQLAGDAEAAEAALAERTAAFDRDRAALLERAREADGRADHARAEAAAARAAAEQAASRAGSVSEARENAAAEIGQAQSRADEAIARARRAAEEATAQARRQSADQCAPRAGRRGRGAGGRAGGPGPARCRRGATGDRRRVADASAATERARAEAAAARDASADARSRPRPPAPGPTPARPRPGGHGRRSAGCARSCAGWTPRATRRSGA